MPLNPRCATAKPPFNAGFQRTPSRSFGLSSRLRATRSRGFSIGPLNFAAGSIIVDGGRGSAKRVRSRMPTPSADPSAGKDTMRVLRIACWVWAVVIMLIMWLPEPGFAGFDLTSATVQGAAFAVGAVLLASADRRRPHFFRRRGDSESPIAYLVIRFKGHLVRIALMLVGYAAILEVGQFFAAGRSFRVAQLAENTAWILLASAAVYALSRGLLANRYLGRITQRHLGRMAASCRSEAMYSADLRDLIQAGYAICTAPSIADAEKVERIREVLDQALAADLPDHGEDVLDTALGARKAVPAPYRASAEAVEQPGSGSRSS